MTRNTATAKIVAIALIPIVYVLSIGPVSLICFCAGIPDTAFETFYFPLIWLDTHTFLHEFFQGYMELWWGKGIPFGPK